MLIVDRLKATVTTNLQGEITNVENGILGLLECEIKIRKDHIIVFLKNKVNFPDDMFFSHNDHVYNYEHGLKPKLIGTNDNYFIYKLTPLGMNKIIETPTK